VGNSQVQSGYLSIFTMDQDDAHVRVVSHGAEVRTSPPLVTLNVVQDGRGSKKITSVGAIHHGLLCSTPPIVLLRGSSSMFSDRYRFAWKEALELSSVLPRFHELPQAMGATAFASILWSDGFGSGGELDRAILRRSAEEKTALHDGRVFVIAPIYVTSICQEQCCYCNYRAGNKGAGVERRRLTDDELREEALYLIEEKGERVLELVYASDPKMRIDTMCRHIELLRQLLEEYGGGLVGISAESFEEKDYRRLVDAGLCWSVLWQETYDKSRYALLHPGNTKKANFEYRLDTYERMLAAGIEHVGIGVLSGLSDWKRDWAMLMLHEEYLQQHYGRGATILGLPRLKTAPGATFQDSPFIPSRQEFLTTVALHNIFSPTTAPFVSTREDWDVCLDLAKGGGCLFTLNCSTTPGGYSLQHRGCQFAANSYDAPIYAAKLKVEGLNPLFNWKASDLAGDYQAAAVAD
jgi:2-iminoacetate synthase ThiH